jgi:glutamate-1-semialdehyde 2,1-aminomutase
LPALASFTIPDRDAATIKTFVTSRMLGKGFLAGPNLYASIAHTPAILDEYFAALGSVFEEIAANDDDELREQLPDGLAQSGFRRLT